MRIGEILALQPNDIHYDSSFGSVTIHRTLTKTKDGKVTIGNTTKTKKGTRCVQLVPKAKEVLEQSIQQMIPNRYNVIFCRNNGSLYTPTQVNSVFKRICKDANIRVIVGKHKKYSKDKEIHYVKYTTSNVHTHMLRHTFATRCIEANIPIEVLQNILGHTNIQTTVDIYGDIFDYLKQKELTKYIEYMSKTDSILSNNVEKFEIQYINNL